MRKKRKEIIECERAKNLKKKIGRLNILRKDRNRERKKQGRIHGSISHVRVGRGSIVVGQGQ